MLGEVCPYDHGYDPVEVDDRNLPQMLTLAGLPAPPPPPNQPGQPPLLMPNVLPPPARPLAPLSAGLPSLNTGLTTVQVQNARPIPSPAEMQNHQVPIFRPRNPIAFIRNIPPPAAGRKYTIQKFLFLDLKCPLPYDKGEMDFLRFLF